MYELHLFAGAGGGILAGQILGNLCIGAVEIDKYAQSVLIARQNDGTLPPFPIWSDVRSFTRRNAACRSYIKTLRRIRDNLCICGGFPCQDISAAGKGAGITGRRSGLWKYFARTVGEIRPHYVFVENSPMLTVRGLGRVLGDLAAIGYDAKWGVLGASDTGAPHIRKRIWIVARRKDVADTDRAECKEQRGTITTSASHNSTGRSGWWSVEPCVGGMVDGLAARMDIHGAAFAGDVGRVASGIRNRVGKIRCLGNGQVPATAALAWKILTRGTYKNG